MPMKKVHRKNGFTLIEMLTVMVMIGIIAALAMPNFDNAVKKVRFKSASNTVLAGLRMARSNAVAKKIQHGVNIDATGNVMTVFRDEVSPGNFTFDAGDSVIFQDTLVQGMQSLMTTFTDDNIFFFPDGRASSSGNVTGSAYWDGLQASMQISVLAATGRVRLDSLVY
ncbi:MAG: prepilin-type N-terminal cleavage/methylation domain-containing protein [candidate division Zixibacteria bacterium]|nr:prepilin-type N-terminal cleavage/methylation domain-containing protein [candidate division Zixibacteria bacterium]